MELANSLDLDLDRMRLLATNISKNVDRITDQTRISNDPSSFKESRAAIFEATEELQLLLKEPADVLKEMMKTSVGADFCDDGLQLT